MADVGFQPSSSALNHTRDVFRIWQALHLGEVRHWIWMSLGAESSVRAQGNLRLEWVCPHYHSVLGCASELNFLEIFGFDKLFPPMSFFWDCPQPPLPRPFFFTWSDFLELNFKKTWSMIYLMFLLHKPDQKPKSLAQPYLSKTWVTAMMWVPAESYRSHHAHGIIRLRMIYSAKLDFSVSSSFSIL